MRDDHLYLATPPAGCRVDPVQRLRRETAHPDGLSASATEGTGAGTSLVGGAIRIGSPILFPECESIRTTVPSSLCVTKTESAVAVSPLGFAPTLIGLPTGRSERGSSRTTLPPSWSANQTLPPVTTIPIGTAHVSPFDRVRRRVDPQHFPGVGGRHPEVAVAGGQRQRAAGREWKGGRDWLERPRVDPQQRPGPCFEGPQVAAPEDGLIDGRVEPATGPARRRSANREQPARRARTWCWTEAISRSPPTRDR